MISEKRKRDIAAGRVQPRPAIWKKYLQRLGYVLLIASFILAALFSVKGYWRWRLVESIRDLEAQGFATTLPNLEKNYRPIPDEKNAAWHFLEAADLCLSKTDYYVKSHEFSEHVELLYPHERIDFTAFPDLLEAVNAHPQWRDRFDRGLQCADSRYRGNDDLDYAFSYSNDYRCIRWLSFCFYVDGIQAVEKKDSAGALEALRRSTALTRSLFQCPYPSISCQLRCYFSSRNQLQVVMRLLSHATLTRQQLIELQDLFKDHERYPDLDICFNAHIYNTIDQGYTRYSFKQDYLALQEGWNWGRKPSYKPLKTVHSAVDLFYWFSGRLEAPNFKGIAIRRYFFEVDRHLCKALNLFEQGSYSRDLPFQEILEDNRARYRQTPTEPGWRYPLLGYMKAYSLHIYHEMAEHRLNYQFILSALALELYRKDHSGALPETLEGLVPDYLTSMPMDPYWDTPLGYLIESLGYRLYSIDPDGEADGGLYFELNKNFKRSYYTNKVFLVKR